jgi:DNA-binding HxlR family transcriptional regulator
MQYAAARGATSRIQRGQGRDDDISGRRQSMKRKCLHASPCPVARALDSIGDWWTLLILRDAFDGLKRFNAIQKNLGIPRNILTARLRLLVDRDILSVAPASDGSVYREYVLTDKGRDLIPVISALRQWGEQHVLAPEAQAEAAGDMGGALMQSPPRRADLGRFVELPEPHTKH